MEIIILLIFIFYSIVLHEISHGFVAYKLGDPTAKINGRLSLNPLVHVDIFGTLILPLFTFYFFNFLFGYAKPVPYNPFYLKNPRRDSLFIALAGPLTNILLMFAFLLLYKSDLFSSFNNIFLDVARLNFNLAFFNLLPLPPLDGSKFLLLWLSLEEYVFLEFYGFAFVFLFILFFGKYFFIISSRLFNFLLSFFL